MTAVVEMAVPGGAACPEGMSSVRMHRPVRNTAPGPNPHGPIKPARELAYVAPALLKRHAGYVTRATGGRGAVREFCEMLLHSRGALTAQTRRFIDTAPH